MMEDVDKFNNNNNNNKNTKRIVPENEQVEGVGGGDDEQVEQEDDGEDEDEDDDQDEEDRDALERLSSAPNLNRKVYSYSQQLGPPRSERRHRQVRKHSLDDIPRPPTSIATAAAIIIPDHHRDISDVDFFSFSSNSSSNSCLLYTSAASVHVPGAPTTTASSSSIVPYNEDDDFYTIPPQFNSGLSSDDLRQPPLPEFLASGGATPMFKSPIRAAVHPGRPPCLELRPHPLRETQVGKFLRNIACTDTQLWAGQESGVRCWNFDNIYDPGSGLGGRVRRGDEDAAPFHESVSTSPTMCLMADSATHLVWTGHKDGKIRSWRMDDDDAHIQDEPLKEGLSWQAHKGPVLSLVMSSYGDMWSGGEGGVIKIWAWETIEKSLALSSAEKHLAALLVERSNIDLRAQVTVNGVCSISSSEIKCLLSDNVKANVWCAQPMSLSLWYVFIYHAVSLLHQVWHVLVGNN